MTLRDIGISGFTGVKVRLSHAPVVLGHLIRPCLLGSELALSCLRLR